MVNRTAIARRAIPSVDRLLNLAAFATLLERYGRLPVIDVVRAVLTDERTRLGEQGTEVRGDDALAECCAEHLARSVKPSL